MRVLRANKDSVMAMLEAFVYDPLISWRLLARPKVVFEHIDRVDSDVGADSSAELDDSVELMRKNAEGAEGAQLLADSDDEVGAGLPLPHLPPPGVLPVNPMVPMSMAADTRRTLSKVAFSDPDRRSLEAPEAAADTLNARAMEVIDRIQAKLTGTDFSDSAEPLDIDRQVDRLIKEATSVENLCQLFPGWCSLW